MFTLAGRWRGGGVPRAPPRRGRGSAFAAAACEFGVSRVLAFPADWEILPAAGAGAAAARRAGAVSPLVAFLAHREVGGQRLGLAGAGTPGPAPLGAPGKRATPEAPDVGRVLELLLAECLLTLIVGKVLPARGCRVRADLWRTTALRRDVRSRPRPLVQTRERRRRSRTSSL